MAVSKMADESEIIKIKDKLVKIGTHAGKVNKGDVCSTVCTFQIDRYVEGVDLSNKTIAFLYQPVGERKTLIDYATKSEVSAKQITFQWILPSHLAAEKGNVPVTIQFIGMDNGEKSYVLTLDMFLIEVGNALSMDEAVDPGESEDWFTRIETRMNYLENYTFLDDALNEKMSAYTEKKGYDVTLKSHTMALKDLEAKISNKMNSIYTSNLGEKYVSDCQNGDIRDMEVQGKTQQKQYQGYQLLDLSKIPTTTKDGITVECVDGNAIRVSGTPTIEEGYVSLTFSNIVHETIINVADTYTINLSEKKKGVSFAILTEEDGALTFPMSSEYVSKTRLCTITRRGLIINVSYDVGEIDFVFSAQLEKGSVVHAYEPYTGGIQSPNVAYPQEMKGIGEINVRMCGKNLAGILADKSVTTAGISVMRNVVNQTISLNGTATAASGVSLLSDKCMYTGEKKGTLKAGVYCFQANAKISLHLYQANTEKAKFVSVNNGKTITLEEDYDYCDMQIRWSTGAVFDNTVLTLQFEEGSTPTEYAPYEEQAFTMAPPKPLYAVGNYKDVCDVEKGVWRYETDMYTIAEMILKDTTGTQKNLVAAVDVSAISGIDAANMGFTELLSDKFAPGEENGEDTVLLNSGRNTVLFYRKYTGNDTETVENVTLLYPLAQAQTQAVEADVLEKLRALHTYYGVTHVFVTDEDGNDISTWFNYHFNLKPYVEYVKEQLADNKELIYDMQEKQLDAQVSNAWSLINAEYAAAVTDFS